MQDSSNRNYIRLSALGVLVVALAAYLLYDPLPYEYEPQPLPDTFEEFLQQKLEASEAAGTREFNEEKLIRYAPKTEYAVLYIHGFGASRGEGEYVFDRVAEKLQANTYYMRLPGHGTNKEDHANTTYKDYLDSVEEAFAMMPKLGDRILIGGCSTGATLATYLASKYPERVAGLILVSPFYEFRDPTTSTIAGMPGGETIITTVMGEVRDARWPEDDPENRKVEGYDGRWLTEQYYSAVVRLNALRAYVAKDHIYGRIIAPTLMLYYYKDEEHQDTVVSVEAMLAALAKFGELQEQGPHPLNRAVAVEDANHIMISEFVRTDKDFIMQTINAFLDDLVQYEQDSK